MSRLDSFQIEQLKEIATYLRERRQEQSLSLEEIATTTFVPLRLLKAIDAGQFNLLPEPVFIQGFLRRYADALGLDGMTIAKSFPIESTPEPEPVDVVETPHPQAKTNDAQPIDSPSGERRFPYWVLGSAVAACLVAVVAIASLANRPKSDPKPVSQNPPAPTGQPSPSKPAPVTPKPSAPLVAASPAPSPSPTIAASPSPQPGQPVEVAVSLSDRSWMEVRVDGKTEFEGMLNKGDQKTWTGKKQVLLRVGNAGAVSASFNQSAAQPLGRAGEVKDVTYPTTIAPEQPAR